MKTAIMALSLAGLVASQDALASEIPCVSQDRLAYAAKKIRKEFKKIRHDTYLIETVPTSKNAYLKGGQLTVYAPIETGLSIFDRTDSNPAKWYNVSNMGMDIVRDGKGCVSPGDYLTGRESYLSASESQARFNEFISKIEKRIQK